MCRPSFCDCNNSDWFSAVTLQISALKQPNPNRIVKHWHVNGVKMRAMFNMTHHT